MLISLLDGTVSFSLFSRFPELLCVISTRKHGDLNIGKKPFSNAMPLFTLLSLNEKNVVVMKQVHSAAVAYVTREQGGTIIDAADGIVTNSTNLYVGVKSADCVPLFFYDPKKKIVGVAHAGWRGTLGKIAATMIEQMKLQGSNETSIHVGIGPHIGGCCYTVLADRAALFVNAFNDLSIAFQNRGTWYLDLARANAHVLLQAGILPEHIDAPITCTSCQNDHFFSYRKERGTSTYGEMLGIIGIRNSL